MSLREYARHRGCHPNAVSYAIQEGRIVSKDGLIDSEAADVSWDIKTQHTKSHDEPKKVSSVVTEARGAFIQARTARELINIEREKVNAKLRELQYLVRVGELVEAKGIEREAFNRFRILRDSMMSIPDRLAGILAVETDEQAIFDLLRAEIEQVFRAFATEEERAA